MLLIRNCRRYFILDVLKVTIQHGSLLNDRVDVSSEFGYFSGVSDPVGLRLFVLQVVFGSVQ